MSKKRKILIVIADQFRADCITGALAEHVDLPNIQAFRKEAVTFTKHYSVTNPCGPSRTSILTGQYAMNHRSIRNGTPLAHDTPNLARELRKSGYDPMLFGYTDTGIDPRAHHPNDPVLKTEEGLMPGFREVLEMRLMESYPWRAYLKTKGYDLPDYAHFYEPVSPDANRPARIDDPTFYKAEDSDTAFLTDTLLQDLSVRTDQDWFALATYIRPHPPLVAPAPYNKMYAPDALPDPVRLPAQEQQANLHPFMAGALQQPTVNTIVKGVAPLDNENKVDVQGLRALYMGLATEVDTHFGRIISFLKETNQYDDTLIIFVADHGEMLGDHHLWGKQCPYEAAYHIPLIIHDPQNPTQYGATVQVLTESTDITPTILDLIGQQIPPSMDGTSLRPFLEGSPPDNWRDCVHMELDYGEPNTTTLMQAATGVTNLESNLAILREDQFKLIHFNGGLAPLLFDLQLDPDEMNNLAADPAHTTTLLRMTQKLLSHRMKHANRSLTGIKITPEGAVGYMQ